MNWNIGMVINMWILRYPPRKDTTNVVKIKRAEERKN